MHDTAFPILFAGRRVEEKISNRHGRSSSDAAGQSSSRGRGRRDRAQTEASKKRVMFVLFFCAQCLLLDCCVYRPWLRADIQILESASGRHVQQLEVSPQVFLISLDDRTLERVMQLVQSLASGDASAARHEPTRDSPYVFLCLSLSRGSVCLCVSLSALCCVPSPSLSFVYCFFLLCTSGLPQYPILSISPLHISGTSYLCLSMCVTRPIYFQTMIFHPLKFFVSYRQLQTRNFLESIQTDNIDDDEEDNTSSYLSAMMYQFGVVLFNVDNAVIRISGIRERDTVFDRSTLEDRFVTHYKAQV